MPTPYANFVAATLDTLFAKQSAKWAGNWYQPRLITVTSQCVRGYVSAGGIDKDGNLGQLPVPTVTPETGPVFCLDLPMIAVLERAAKACDRPAYGELVAYIEGLLGDYGFDPRSGLSYISVECEIDTRTMGPGSFPNRPVPRFKFSSEMYYDRLWRVAPEKLARALRATYYGLVTRPENMDFNRYCFYGWDDRTRKHQLDFDPWHVAFASASSWAIQAWVYLHVKTGDAEALQWATRMTDKWAALQNPTTGLVPHFLGAKDASEKTQTVQPYCHSSDITTALSYLESARLLADRPQSAALAAKLRGMGLALARGIARHAYEPNRRMFYTWLKTADGSPASDTIIYHFFSQAQKDEWLRKDPTLQVVAVSPGTGLYDQPAPSSFFLGSGMEFQLAKLAERTGDAELTATLTRVIREALDQRQRMITGPITADGYWVYGISASHMQALLALHRITREQAWLEAAKRIADQELDFLARPEANGQNEQKVEWWRWPSRGGILNAMLELDQALK